MRIPCPFCGSRPSAEFACLGDARLMERPEAGPDADFVYIRDNPAGRHRELWRHEAGCGAWLVVERDTVTHEVFGVELAEAVRAG